MFLNRRIRINPELMSDEARNAIDYANALLADSTQGLTFDAEQHRYHIGNTEFHSVSSIVEAFDPFDVVECAEGCSRNPEHEMFGKSTDEIISIWNAKAAVSASAGTDIHEFGEACFLLKSGYEDKVPDKFKSRFTDIGMTASAGKEEAVANWWNALDLDRYIPVAKESKVVNISLGYAGTFDILLYDMENRHYILRDYKTNADLFRWFKKMMRPPFSMIRNDNAGKYTIQQNLYALQLDNIGIHVGEMKLIWLKDNGSYQEVELRDIRNLLKHSMTKELIKEKLNS